MQSNEGSCLLECKGDKGESYCRSETPLRNPCGCCFAVHSEGCASNIMKFKSGQTESAVAWQNKEKKTSNLIILLIVDKVELPETLLLNSCCCLNLQKHF